MRGARARGSRRGAREFVARARRARALTRALSGARAQNAIKSLGLRVDHDVAYAVVKYYDVDGDGEMRYGPLIEDVARGQRHFLHHPGPSARFEDEPVKRKPLTPFITLFLKKLKMKLQAHMKKHGEYERILIRRAFLNWDADASGELSCREFMGAMRQVGISLREDEARKIVEFYDVEGDGEMRYQPLVDDVTAGAAHFIHHPDALEGHKPQVEDPDEILLAKMFTVRPMERQKNAVVEAFKINLRRRLEDHIKAVGGTIQSILRESFLFWDVDSSGELNPEEFRGAMSRLGLHISADEASQVVKYYDSEGKDGRWGDNEISYGDVIDDVVKGTQHFLDHPSSSRVVEPPPLVEAPADVKGWLRKIRDCVLKRVRAGKGGLPPGMRGGGGMDKTLDASDLLHGTLLRFDKGSTGHLNKAMLKRALDELRVDMTENDVGRLLWWYDEDASDTVAYKKIVKDAFGADMGRGANSALGASRSLPMLPGVDAQLTARSKRQTIIAEKGRIERRLKELQMKESKLKVAA